MIIKAISLLAVLLFTLALSACIESDNDNPQPAAVSDLQEPETSILSGSASNLDIDGIWKAECHNSNHLAFNLGSGFVTATYDFSGGSVSYREIQYTDSTCTGSGNTSVAGVEATFGDEITTPSGVIAQQIDLWSPTGGWLWKGLVARDASGLLLIFSKDGSPRPVDVDSALVLSKDSSSSDGNEEGAEITAKSIGLEGKWIGDCNEIRSSELILGGQRTSFEFNRIA